MPRHLALLLGAVALLALGTPPARVFADPTTYLGPTRILFVDADTVLTLVTKEWLSASTRHQEKLLRHGVRMAYWRSHISPDMGKVFDGLGYPLGRVIHTPVGHTEEWWYYGLLDPPIRFRDGELIDADRFEDLLGE
jgi:hypothetical protein